jgi:hypothetical protein
METLVKILAHPLTVAVASALLSLVLVTLLTKKWQDRQREIDIKSKLVTDMTAVMAEPIANSRIWSRGASVGTEMPSYSETLRRVDMRKAEVGTLLQVYFSEAPTLLGEWENYAKALNYCVRMTAADDPIRKLRHVEIVRNYVKIRRGTIEVNWDVLGTQQYQDGFGSEFEKSYEALTTWMLQRGNQIVRSVLTKRIQLVDTRDSPE